MKKFFKGLVAVAVVASVLSTVAFAADGVILKRDFSDGVKEDAFQGSSASTEIKDGALYITTGKGWESPYWELGTVIKEAMENNKLTEATVTVSFEIESEDIEKVGVLIREVANRTSDVAEGSGNIFIRLGTITDLSVNDYEFSFEMTEEDLAGITAGDKYKFMFDNINGNSIDEGETVGFTIDNLVVSIDELAGSNADTGSNTDGDKAPANKPTNTGDVLPVATVVLALGAVVSLTIVSKKKREI